MYQLRDVDSVAVAIPVHVRGEIRRKNNMTREMTHEELQKVIEQHKHWINEDCEGWQDLRADLREADLRRANLRRANLRRTNLRRTNLHEANLREADLNYSCLPLVRGSLEANFDSKQLKQIAYHLVKAGLHSKNTTEEDKMELRKLIDYANQFHRAEECGIIEIEEDK